MPETGESHGSSATASNDGGMVPNQLAVLVPTFDPSRDDIDTWAKKVELLMHAWPDGKITELAGDEADTGYVRVSVSETAVASVGAAEE